MDKEKYYRKMQKERKELLHQKISVFIDDYKKYGFTLLEIYDRILNRVIRSKGVVKTYGKI